MVTFRVWSRSTNCFNPFLNDYILILTQLSKNPLENIVEKVEIAQRAVSPFSTMFSMQSVS